MLRNAVSYRTGIEEERSQGLAILKKQGIVSIVLSRNLTRIGGLLLNVIGRINYPRRGTTFGSLTSESHDNQVGCFYWLDRWRRERAQAAIPEYIERLSNVTGNAVMSYVLDHPQHVFGGQVQHVRIHYMWYMINKSSKIFNPTLPVPRQKHPSIVRFLVTRDLALDCLALLTPNPCVGIIGNCDWATPLRLLYAFTRVCNRFIDVCMFSFPPLEWCPRVLHTL